MAKKKALYTFLSVKELEMIQTLIKMQLEREKLIKENCVPESRTWKEQSYYINALTSLFFKTEKVRVKTCFLDEEYKKEVKIGE